MSLTNTFFGNTLIKWYQQHKRNLPWRETSDAYAIWLSEIILQQTRVAQGLPYYLKLIEAYPTVQDLAAAPEDEVLRFWQGLGYYSRARNMHFTAKQIVSDYGGRFPESYQELLKLKGVGSYTAAAIASFAFREKVAVLDGNVFRVLSRVFGISEDIALPATKKIFQQLADKLICEQEPDIFNQAIMEFGAIQCTPVMPDCMFCPLQTTCFAFNHGLIQELPVKSKAKAARARYFHYLVFKWQGLYYMRKRLKGDIWQSLYDFYLHEAFDENLTTESLLYEIEKSGISLNIEDITIPTKEYKHVLSHQRISAKFYLIKLKDPLTKSFLKEGRLTAFDRLEIENLPKPILINNYLKNEKILLSL
jgi:A/G-specific adenine glycosylase